MPSSMQAVGVIGVPTPIKVKKNPKNNAYFLDSFQLWCRTFALLRVEHREGMIVRFANPH